MCILHSPLGRSYLKLKSNKKNKIVIFDVEIIKSMISNPFMVNYFYNRSGFYNTFKVS